MMDTNNAVIGTAAIVIVGTWAQDKPVSVRIVVGGMFAAIGLSLLNEASPKLAGRFAMLILIVAMFEYVPAIAYKAGLINSVPAGPVKITKRMMNGPHSADRKK